MHFYLSMRACASEWHAPTYRVIRYISCLCLVSAIFDFIELQLKGNTGEEIVKVYQPGVEGRLIRSIALTKGWQKYSFDSLEGVRLHFVNNNLPRNVYLKHPKLYEIGFNDGNRHCRMGSKSQLCSRIQKLGNFLWGGSYAIKKKYEGMLSALLSSIGANPILGGFSALDIPLRMRDKTCISWHQPELQN